MAKPILEQKVVVRKVASLGETLVSGIAGNGATKANALEVRIVPGRLPILTRRKEAEPKALAKIIPKVKERAIRGDK